MSPSTSVPSAQIAALLELPATSRRIVFSDPQSRELDATISETAMPAPIRLHSWRKGRSVTPAMGATTRLFLRETFPIFTAFVVGL